MENTKKITIVQLLPSLESGGVERGTVDIAKALKRENFEFLRKIDNWNENPDLEIIPISISESYLKIKVSDYLMDIGLTEDNNFRIFTRYKDEKNSSRMSTTELLKIITKKDF